MPTERAASSNWSTVFTYAQACLADVAKRRSGALLWLAAEPITAPGVNNKAHFYGFLNYDPFQPSRIHNLPVQGT
jgi:hypothetical protein